jgi:hypothetical protein
MTREEIIRMAREAGFTVGPSRDGPDDVWGVGANLERFAKLVRDDYSNKHANLWLDRCHAFMRTEREECAKVCDELAGILACHNDKDGSEICISLRDTIRARGNT